MISGLVSIFLAAILTENYILSKFLGICPFLGVSKKLNTAAVSYTHLDVYKRQLMGPVGFSSQKAEMFGFLASLPLRLPPKDTT